MSDNQPDAVESAFAALDRLDLALCVEECAHLNFEAKMMPVAENILRRQSAAHGVTSIVNPIVNRSSDLEPPLGLVDGHPVVAYGLMLQGFSAGEAHVR
jgi:hypothetical protein